MSSLVNVGDVLATKYRVDKILGIGGMGMVVAATHLELDQKVALKFMLPEAMRSEQAMDRFLREAKAAVKLRSEHVCRVLDVGKLDTTGAPYIVMEFMEGQDFADTIKHAGRLSVGDTVEYVLQALEGLAEAHANNIVHRDLKPGNLFVTTDNDGTPLVKVLDFGISKSSIAGSATRTGDIMGSPSYMAPEQMASSKNVDGRADLWAMGVILYQAVTGLLPFEADTLPALCMAVMTAAPVPIGTVRPDLPPGFVMVINRCLEKKPELRYADVAELAAALVPFGSSSAATAATRITKVLRRSTPVARVTPPMGVAVTLMSTSDMLSAAAVSASAVHAQSQPPPGRISTLQASAAEVSIATSARPKRTGLILAGIGTTVAAAIVIGVMFGGGGGGANDAKPAEQPTLPVAPPVTPAAIALPSEAKPVIPPPAPPPVVPAAVPEVVPVPAVVATEPTTKTTHKATTKSGSKTVTKNGTVATKPVTTPVDVKQVETKPTETKPVETKPVETKAAETKPAETKPAGSKWTHMQHDKGH